MGDRKAKWIVVFFDVAHDEWFGRLLDSFLFKLKQYQDKNRCKKGRFFESAHAESINVNRQVNGIVFYWEGDFEGTHNRWTQGEIHRCFFDSAYAESINVKQTGKWNCFLPRRYYWREHTIGEPIVAFLTQHMPNYVKVLKESDTSELVMSQANAQGYGVATVSRIDKVVGLFCSISSLL